MGSWGKLIREISFHPRMNTKEHPEEIITNTSCLFGEKKWQFLYIVK